MKYEKYEPWSELNVMRVCKESRQDEIIQIIKVITDKEYIYQLTVESSEIDKWFEMYGRTKYNINCPGENVIYNENSGLTK